MMLFLPEFNTDHESSKADISWHHAVQKTPLTHLFQTVTGTLWLAQPVSVSGGKIDSGIENTLLHAEKAVAMVASKIPHR
jgi:hypothetical protein